MVLTWQRVIGVLGTASYVVHERPVRRQACRSRRRLPGWCTSAPLRNIASGYRRACERLRRASPAANCQTDLDVMNEEKISALLASWAGDDTSPEAVARRGVSLAFLNDFYAAFVAPHPNAA